jgi:hypothetical protein
VYYVFDLDGTISIPEHRRHLLPNWDAFSEACDLDEPNVPVIEMLNHLCRLGHRVGIWSARTVAVEGKTTWWLNEYGVNPRFLERMRPLGNFDPDEKLKRQWLHEATAAGERPDAIFDDRQKVVDMWRAEGMQCFQVAPGDFDKPKTIRPHDMFESGGIPILHLMVGPSGAGKTTIVEDHFDPQIVVATDYLRHCLTLDEGDQSRNKAVVVALHAIVKTRMDCGLITVVDATNIRAADRKALVKLVRPGHRCAYIVVNRSLEDKHADAGRRAGATVRNGPEIESLIDGHERVFQANMKYIQNGDGFDNVDVFYDLVKYEDKMDALYAAWDAKNEAAISATHAENRTANLRMEAEFIDKALTGGTDAERHE